MFSLVCQQNHKFSVY